MKTQRRLRVVELSPLDYYSSQGPFSDPGDEAACFGRLPKDVARLRDIVQGVVIHVFWADRYGVTVPDSRQQELQLRSVSAKLKRIRSLDGSPITRPRPPDRRLLGNCRDFSILLCSILRHQGVPARARCGFATYFVPGHFEDHWVCEYWAKTRRWVMVDAQLDALQRERLGIDFDPLDVPADRFIVGGKAWQMCRSGRYDPDMFGISELPEVHGFWFVRGDLVRDFASLNKVELLPWDAWGLMDRDGRLIKDSDMSLLDEVAALSQSGNEAFAEVRNLYLGNDSLRVPRTIRSYTRSGREDVDIGGPFS
jgi:hypothetical protein